MKETYDVIIGGVGIVGAMMALSLADSGLKVAVIDEVATAPKKSSNFDGRAYALSPSTFRMLSCLKLWNDLATDVQPILDIKVSDGLAGLGASPLHMHLDHREMEEGPIGFMVEDRYLRKVLLDKLIVSRQIDKIFRTSIINQKILPGYVEIELSNNKIITTKILVGSDGRQSKIASNAGIKRTIYDYNQTSLVCAVSHEHDHFGEAHQFFMPNGPLAILPLTQNRSSIVWTETNVVAQRIAQLGNKEFLKELKYRFGDFRGQIFLEGKRYSYPLSLSMSDKIYSNRVALIGDAAHALHPVAGQGLNLGMRDAASLAEILIFANRRGEDIGSLAVLKRYSSWRQLDRALLSGFTHTVNKLFSNDSLILRAVRDLSMATINKIPFLRRSLMAEASGLEGDLPLLLRGKRI